MQGVAPSHFRCLFLQKSHAFFDLLVCVCFVEVKPISSSELIDFRLKRRPKKVAPSWATGRPRARAAGLARPTGLSILCRGHGSPRPVKPMWPYLILLCVAMPVLASGEVCLSQLATDLGDPLIYFDFDQDTDFVNQADLTVSIPRGNAAISTPGNEF